MDDSLDRHVKDSSPRKLLRKFMEVMEPKDTPALLRNRAAATKERPPKGTFSSSQQRGGDNLHSEVLHHQAGQSSFMDQTLSVSVIQGINQTYANIVAPDSDNSSVNSSIDLEKGAKFRKQKKRKLQTAPLPAEMVTRPPSKKKKKKTVVLSSDATEEAVHRQDFITANTMAQETQDIEAQDNPKGPSTEAGTAGEKIHSMPQEATSAKERAEHPVRASPISPDVPSISAVSPRSDATYDFSADYDDTLSNIMETKRRFGNQITSRKLNLAPLIEALQAKQKSASPVTVADIVDTLNAPEVQVTSPEKASQEPLEASDEELNMSHSPSQIVDDDAIPPPQSFRDSEVSRSTILREANFTDAEHTSNILLRLEESDDDMGQDQLPKTPAPLEDDDLVVDLQRSASAAQRKSLGQVIDASTIKTPTRSSLRKSVSKITDVTPTKLSSRSVGQIIDATTTTFTPTRSSFRESESQATDAMTPTRSSPRESVGQVTDATTMTSPTRSSPRRNLSQVIATGSAPGKSVDHVIDATTTKTPTRSSPRKSVGQVIDATTMKTLTRSSPRKSVGQVSASKSSPRSVGQFTNATAMKTPTKSTPRRSVGHVSVSKSSPRSVGNINASKSSPWRSVGHVSANKSSPRSVGHVSASKSSPRRSVGHISASKLSPRRSVGHVSASKSSPRRSLGRVSASKSSPWRSVGHVTPSKSSPRRSVGHVSASKSSLTSVAQVTDVITTKTTTTSSPRWLGQASAIITTPNKSTPRKSVGQVTPSESSLRRSMAQVTDVTTNKTPTRSSPRRSVSQVTDATTTKTPTRSSPRRSVGRVTDVTTTKIPTRSSPRGVGQVDTSITTPSRSSPRQSLGRNISSVLVSPQKGNVVDNTVLGGSLGRSRNAQERQRDATAKISVASPAKESHEIEEESPEKISRTSKSLPEGDAENTSLSDIENEFSLIPVTVSLIPLTARPSFGHMADTHTRDEEEMETSRETSPLSIEALPSQETATIEQPSAPSSTAKVRQMTMREFLAQLKTKPVQPPLTKPKPLLPTLLGAAAPSTSQPKPRGRPKGKTTGKKKHLPASLPRCLTKEVFTHFAKCKVTKGALAEVMKVTEIFWENLTKDVCAMQAAKKNPTKSIQHQDVEKLMKRQGLTTSQESLDALVEQLLPMEMWSMFKTFPEPAQNPFPSFTGPLFNP